MKRVSKQIEPRFRAMEERLDRLDTGWRQHIPAFLNSVSSVGAFGHELAGLRGEVTELGGAQQKAIRDMEQRLESQAAVFQRSAASADQSIGRLWDRVEFVRREVMYEMAYGRSAARQSGGEVERRVVNQQRIDEQRNAGGIRLNLGCGHIPLDGYVNVDMRELPGVDIIADAGDIPLEPESVSEIFSAHMLEHFPQEEVKRRLLPYWRELLVKGGQFRAIVPDGEAMLAGAAAGTYPFEDFREVLFGAQDYHGDFHYNMFTPESLSALLREAGYIDIAVPVKGRVNGKCFEFEIQAKRG
ncbi:class I SAM-dependent methyltransferase [Inquilinus limosus]|uniref:class I SAM-dependent methyltransferase n=1 Tax=Inquilinus limosus TaxID=171674 RepID=UPI001EE7030E|nr:hypothetical protein [Inquilinus limosus]